MMLLHDTPRAIYFTIHTSLAVIGAPESPTGYQYLLTFQAGAGAPFKAAPIMADDEGEQLGLGALYSRDFGDDDDDADADFEAGSEDEEEDLDFEACGDDEHDGHAAPSASTKPSIASAPQDGRTASGGVGEALASGQPEKMKTGSAGAEQQEHSRVEATESWSSEVESKK